MIKLTVTDKLPIWINPTHVVTIEVEKGDNRAEIRMLSGRIILVKESAKEVASLCGMRS